MRKNTEKEKKEMKYNQNKERKKINLNSQISRIVTDRHLLELELCVFVGKSIYSNIGKKCGVFHWRGQIEGFYI